MKIDVKTFIKQTPDKVFAYMTNSTNRPKWDTSMLEMEQTSTEPKGVGTTYRGAYRMMGSRRRWTARLTKYEPDRGVGYDISSGKLRTEQTVSLLPIAEGTELSFATQMDLKGLLTLLAPLVTLTVKRQTTANLQRLKQILES
jgi:uncharacterized protein YndB with AHSA1/START domain